jgi:hypothetical protein
MEALRKEFHRSVADQFLQGYQIVAGFLGVIFLLVIPLRLAFQQPRELAYVCSVEAAAAAVCLLVFAAFAGRMRRWFGHVENLGMLLAFIALGNNLALMAILREPNQSMNYVLALAAIGIGFQSLWRFAFLQSLCFASWIATYLLWMDLREFPLWAFGMATAALLGIAFHLFNKQVLTELEQLRAQDDALLRERDQLIEELSDALDRVKTLKGLIPICAQCKKIRNDQGFWQAVEAYVMDCTDAEFTHGLCPGCSQGLQAEFEAVLGSADEESGSD